MKSLSFVTSTTVKSISIDTAIRTSRFMYSLCTPCMYWAKPMGWNQDSDPPFLEPIKLYSCSRISESLIWVFFFITVALSFIFVMIKCSSNLFNLKFCKELCGIKEFLVFGPSPQTHSQVVQLAYRSLIVNHNDAHRSVSPKITVKESREECFSVTTLS